MRKQTRLLLRIRAATSRAVGPNGGMTSGATHQAGSQRMTVSRLAHPQPTFNVGRDEGGILPLIESQEI
jgi:hypothetical protein